MSGNSGVLSQFPPPTMEVNRDIDCHFTWDFSAPAGFNQTTGLFMLMSRTQERLNVYFLGVDIRGDFFNCSPAHTCSAQKLKNAMEPARAALIYSK